MEIVHEPSRKFTESTNVYQFMHEFGIEDYDELIDLSCGGVEWFWDELVDSLRSCSTRTTTPFATTPTGCSSPTGTSSAS